MMTMYVYVSKITEMSVKKNTANGLFLYWMNGWLKWPTEKHSAPWLMCKNTTFENALLMRVIVDWSSTPENFLENYWLWNDLHVHEKGHPCAGIP